MWGFEGGRRWARVARYVVRLGHVPPPYEVLCTNSPYISV